MYSTDVKNINKTIIFVFVNEIEIHMTINEIEEMHIVIKRGIKGYI